MLIEIAKVKTKNDNIAIMPSVYQEEKEIEHSCITGLQKNGTIM